jgi:hypothetical protein
MPTLDFIIEGSLLGIVKIFIHCLKEQNGSTTTHEANAAKIQSHFENMLSHAPAPRVDFNWATLGLRHHDLSSLDATFLGQEIKRAIDLLPTDKAPRPDGFTRLFFRTCWSIIKGDVIRATNAFHALLCGSLSLIDTANVILIPKKKGPRKWVILDR